jgi:uncharacterized protein (TIGR02444 family)
MISLFQSHPFCRFSDHIKQQAEESLLALKNRHELNADLLLFCYWFAADNQGLLSKNQIKRLLAAIYSWHQKIVSPLNTLCHQITESIELNLWTQEDSAYDAASKTLHTAEQIEQLLLAEVLPKKPRRGRGFLAQTATHACLNVSAYCQATYVSLDETDYQCLAHLSLAIFPDMDAIKTLSLIRATLSARPLKEPLQKNLPIS